MVKIVSEYLLVQKFREGLYCQVWRARHQIQNKQYTVKIINAQIFDSSLQFQRLRSLCQIMLNLKPNDHIVAHREMLRTKYNYYFVDQYCNGGSLEELLIKQNTLNEQAALLIFKQLIKALQVLHKENIMHRDIKPSNILFHNGIVKIGDFWSSQIVSDKPFQIFVGSPSYMAPQILNKQSYSSKADIWSIGAVLYEMVYGQCPFQQGSIPKLIKKMNDTELAFPQNIFVSNCLKKLLQRMLTKDPQKRITWDQLFKVDILNEGELYLQKNKQTIVLSIYKKTLSFCQQIRRGLNIIRRMGLSEERLAPLFTAFTLKIMSERMKRFVDKQLSIDWAEVSKLNILFIDQIIDFSFEFSRLIKKVQYFSDWKVAMKQKVSQFKSMKQCYELVMLLLGEVSREVSREDEMREIIKERLGI